MKVSIPAHTINISRFFVYLLILKTIMANKDKLTQLDNSEKHGIVTDEELLQRGVIYDSGRRTEENIRRISEARKQTAKTGFSRDFKDKSSIPRGTSLVEESRVQHAKSINSIGKYIKSHEDAAVLLSLFRDPRIEISNLILTSEKGEILAHRAYTAGVPGATLPLSEDILNYLTKEIKLFNPKKAWISHNHPSGNSEPSFNDLFNVKKAFELFNKLNINLAGSLVLGDEIYSVINSNSQYFQKELAPEYKIYNHELLKQESLNQASLCAKFKDVLTLDDDINIITVLNGDNKLVSWNYIDNEKDIESIYNYLRESGGECVSILSNNENNYEYYEKLANKNINSERDIFLNIVKINKKTNVIQLSYINNEYSWNEAIALNNPTMHLINRDVIQQERLIETARKIGHVQGVCECVAAIGDNYTLGKKLLTEMNVTKDMAQKFANPETYKNLEQGIFAQKQEQTLEQTQGLRR